MRASRPKKTVETKEAPSKTPKKASERGSGSDKTSEGFLGQVSGRALKQGWRNWGVGKLVLALVVVVLSGVLFVGAASGWFDGGKKVVLDAEYVCRAECDGEFLEGESEAGLNAREYEELIAAKKSFILLVDQGGCTTAERLKGYMRDFMKEAGGKAYRMMFSEVKNSSLHEKVKYYPSVVVVSRGEVIGFLRADSDEDAKMYNDYEEFKGWLRGLGVWYN